MSEARRLRVLVIHRYYWPDTPPYASLLRAIVARWTADGHHVDVLTSQPSYKTEVENAVRPTTERLDGATVRRISMQPDRSGRVRRLLNVVWFPLVVASRILRGRRYDVVMCSTAPPVLLGAAVSWAARRRGAAFIYHCMDLHPEIGALSGDFSRPSVYRLMMRLEVATCRRAARIVVLSDDMRDAVLRRDAALADRVVVLNNFDLPDYGPEKVTAPLPPRADDRVRIAFTGNVGRFQGLDLVTRAVLGDDPVLDRFELVFMGEGAARRDLEGLVAAAPPDRRHRVCFLPHGSAAAARALLHTADLGLVSLTPGVISFAYPSKTATYLSEGLPLLVAVEEDSQLARTVESDAVGARLPADEDAIRCVLVEIAEDPAVLRGMSARARDVWRRSFSADELLPRWSQVLQGAIPDREVR